MSIQGLYCEGSHCKKRDTCALHCVEPGEYEFIDWSTYGSGQYWNDPDGTPRCKVEYSCGDNGDYKQFQEAQV